VIFYYLDASAWVKRYYWESGTQWVQELFAQNPTIACASLGLIEVMATLARKRKARDIDLLSFEQKVQELEEDWVRFIQIQLTIETMDLAQDLAKNMALRGADAVGCSLVNRFHLAASILNLLTVAARLLAHLIDTSADHVFDLGCVDARTIDQALEREAEHLDGVPGAELATPFAKWSAQGADDDRVPRATSGVAVAVVHAESLPPARRTRHVVRQGR